MKILLICLVPIPIAIWTILGVGGSAIMGVGYGFVWPVMETFRAISKKDLPFHTRLSKCFTVCWICLLRQLEFRNCCFKTYFLRWLILSLFYKFCRMELGLKFRVPALSYVILLIFPSTHTSHSWMTCSIPRGRDLLNSSIRLFKIYSHPFLNQSFFLVKD